MGIVFVGPARLYTDGAELTGQVRATALEYSADALDATTLGSTTRARVGGLKNIAFSHEGFWDASQSSSQIDATIFDRIGQSNIPVTLAPEGATDGSRAFLFEALHAEYSPARGSVGELFGYNMSGFGDDILVRGYILRNTTALTAANATGTAFQLSGDPTSNQNLYAIAHVLGSATGSSEQVTVTIESDNSSAFGSPTTVITFTATTGDGGEWKSYTTATTDDWFRQNCTLPTSSGTYTVLVSAGLSTL